MKQKIPYHISEIYFLQGKNLIEQHATSKSIVYFIMKYLKES